MKFAHLEHENTVLDYQGAQIPYIGFDELTHFEESQFLYMLSRNRSMSGVKGYIRATTNPDADSWVRKFIDWWIGEDGFPIRERSGKLRWFVRIENELHWADTQDSKVFEDLRTVYGRDNIIPLSLTFIPSLLDDNQVLVKADPAYRAKLLAMPRVERERLLLGNWDTRPSSGTFFKKQYFTVYPALTNTRVVRQIRYWDRAATKPSEANPNPDYTVGIKLGQLEHGGWVVLDMVRFRGTPLEVERAVRNTALQDGYQCEIGLEQDPGSAGISDVENMVRKLGGFIVRVFKPTKDKITRAMPVSAQCEHGFVCVLQAPWNSEFFMELETFPSEGTSAHDDIVDALSGSFNALAQGASILDVL